MAINSWNLRTSHNDTEICHQNLVFSKYVLRRIMLLRNSAKYIVMWHFNLIAMVNSFNIITRKLHLGNRPSSSDNFSHDYSTNHHITHSTPFLMQFSSDPTSKLTHVYFPHTKCSFSFLNHNWSETETNKCDQWTSCHWPWAAIEGGRLLEDWARRYRWDMPINNCFQSSTPVEV